MKYVYKIVTVILAVVTVVVLITAPIANVAVKSMIAQIAGFIGQASGNQEITEVIQNNNGEMPEYITEDIAIIDFISPDEDSIVGIAMKFMDDEADEKSSTIKMLTAPAFTLILSAIAILVCVISVIVCAFKKNNRTVIYSSIMGIASCFMVKYSFETIEYLFVSQKVRFEGLLQSSWAGLIGDFEEVALSPSFWAVAGVFVAIIVFTILYNYTLPEKEKAQRKEILGET